MGDFCSGKKIHNQIKEIGDTLGLTTFVAVVGQTQGELSILDVSPRLSLSRHKNSLLPTTTGGLASCPSSPEESEALTDVVQLDVTYTFFFLAPKQMQETYFVVIGYFYFTI